jgi:uncharacterized protein (TIGR00725 family)
MSEVKKIPIIGVMGSGSMPYSEKSVPLGRWIARAGCHLLTGAGAGVMAAVSKAFYETRDRRGLSIGIIPGKIEKDAYQPLPGYPNPWIDIPVFTHLPLSGRDGTAPFSRNHINILSAQLIVALPGSDGTKSEIILALKYRKTVLGFFKNTSEIFDESLDIECYDSLAELTNRISEALGI